MIPSLIILFVTFFFPSGLPCLSPSIFHKIPGQTSIMLSRRLWCPLQGGGLQRRPLSSLRGRGSRLGPRKNAGWSRQVPQPRKADEKASIGIPTQESIDTMASNYDPAQNTLLSPVHLPEDPNGVLKENHPATNILANSGLVVQRQLEMLNFMMYVEIHHVSIRLCSSDMLCAVDSNKRTNTSSWMPEEHMSDTWRSKKKAWQTQWHGSGSVRIEALSLMSLTGK